MRDAFGGVFMIRLILVILFIYVTFTAISINYAKAFRIKNAIIDVIEENEIKVLGDTEKIESKLDTILTKFNYDKECATEGFTEENGKKETYCHKGIFISVEKQDDKNIYYKVTTKAGWNLGALTNLISSFAEKESDNKLVGAWEISGTAKVAIK